MVGAQCRDNEADFKLVDTLSESTRLDKPSPNHNIGNHGRVIVGRPLTSNLQSDRSVEFFQLAL